MDNNQSNQASQNQTPSQNFQISDSDISESTIGGQARRDINQVSGNQVARDLIQVIVGGKIAEDREQAIGEYLNSAQVTQLVKETHTQLERVQDTLTRAKERVSNLRLFVERQIDDIKPNTKKNELLDLIYDLQVILDQKDSLEEIIRDSRFDVEAATWLVNKLSDIVDSTTDFVFSQNPLPPLKDKLLRRKLSISELRIRFSQTISTYVSSLLPFVRSGSAKVRFDKQARESIFLDFSNDVYVSALEDLKKGLLTSDYEREGISREAAQVVCRYINRCLIDQEFKV